MPDLQTELSRLLTQKHFDDDVKVVEAVPIPPEKSAREMLWEVLHANPMTSAAKLADLAGMAQNFVAGAVYALHERGLVTRKIIAGVYHYTTAVDAYPRFNWQEHAKRMAGKRRTGKQPRGKTKKAADPAPAPAPAPETKPKYAEYVTMSPPPAPAAAAAATAFDVDNYLATLSVFQARAVYDKLKQLFGE